MGCFGAARALAARFSLLLFPFASLSSFAKVVVVTDFDDTLVETAVEHSGVFSTDYYAFKVLLPEDHMYSIPETADEVAISAQDWERLTNGTEGPYSLRRQSAFAHSPNQPNLGSGVVTIENAAGKVTIDPGFYYVDNPASYRRYMDVGNGKTDPLLEDFIAAERKLESLRKKNPGKYRIWGLFFPLFRYYLDREETRSEVYFNTARMNRFDPLLKYWLKKKYISALPMTDDAHMLRLSDERQRVAALGETLRMRKMEVLKAQIQRLTARLPEAKEVRLSPNGDAQLPYHTLIYAEDKPEYWLAAAKLFREKAMEKHPIKFILVFAGSAAELQDPRLNSWRLHNFTVFQEDGGFREATPEEILGEFPIEKPEHRTLLKALKKGPLRDCAAKLAQSL